MLVWPPADPEAGPAIILESRSNLLHQGGQPMQHLPHQAPPTCREHGGDGKSSSWCMGLCQGYHSCLCDFPSYRPLPSSEEMYKLASRVKNQERSLCAQGFAVS